MFPSSGIATFRIPHQGRTGGDVLIIKPDSQDINQRRMHKLPSASFLPWVQGWKTLSLPRGHQALCNAPWLQLHFSPDRQWGSLMGLPRGGREALLERLGTFFSKPKGTARLITRSFYLQRTPGHPECPKARNSPRGSSRVQEPRFLQ